MKLQATQQQRVLTVNDRTGEELVLDARLAHVLQGEKGEKGDPGQPGATGPVGLRGEKGETGPQGAPGIRGFTGEKGEKGERGDGLLIAGRFATLAALQAAYPSGVAGSFEVGVSAPYDYYYYDVRTAIWNNSGPLKGVQGDPGLQGPQGVAGPQGIQGPAGAKGERGDSGMAGATGPRGTIGASGTTPHIDPATGHWFLGMQDTGVLASGFVDAPSDGKQYARKDGDWAQVQAGGSRSLVENVTATAAFVAGEEVCLARMNGQAAFSYTSQAGQYLAGYGKGVAVTPDGSILVVAHDGAPYVSWYKWSGNSYTKQTALTAPSGVARRVAVSDDGSRIFIACESSYSLDWYLWNGSVYVKQTQLQLSSFQQTGTLAINNDGTAFFVGSSITNGIRRYTWNETAYTLKDTLPFPYTGVYDLAVSSDQSLVFAVSTTSPYVVWYKWSGTGYVRQIDINVTGNPQTVAVSADGSRVLVSCPGSIILYGWNGTVYADQGAFVTEGIGNTCQIAITPDGQRVFSAHSSGQGTSWYLWNGQTYVKQPDLTALPVDEEGYTPNGRSVAVTADGTRLFITGDNSGLTYDMAATLADGTMACPLSDVLTRGVENVSFAKMLRKVNPGDKSTILKTN
ncbi:MAG: hypothetical protein LBU80_05325 [Rikenellaceae bacterium]|jgi:WD40 repeat protein|nr:hypothetical protein [Rikenellaceae bacterium]